MRNTGKKKVCLKVLANSLLQLKRGLPSDDGDDLLTGDNTALHLSDYDVYAKTNGRQQLSNEYTRGTLYIIMHVMIVFQYTSL